MTIKNSLYLVCTHAKSKDHKPPFPGFVLFVFTFKSVVIKDVKWCENFLVG